MARRNTSATARKTALTTKALVVVVVVVVVAAAVLVLVIIVDVVAQLSQLIKDEQLQMDNKQQRDVVKNIHAISNPQDDDMLTQNQDTFVDNQFNKECVCCLDHVAAACAQQMVLPLSQRSVGSTRSKTRIQHETYISGPLCALPHMGPFAEMDTRISWLSRTSIAMQDFNEKLEILLVEKHVKNRKLQRIHPTE